MELLISDIISPQDLARRLSDMGYRPSLSIEERGTFCKKGEIFDLFPLNGPAVRIHYFDDMIEEIFSIDLQTQRTLRQNAHEKITIDPVPNVFNSSMFSKTLRTHIPRLGIDQKEKNLAREDIFNKLSRGELFDSYSVYCPLFLKETAILFDYFDLQKDILCLFNSEQGEQKICLSCRSVWRRIRKRLQ